MNSPRALVLSIAATACGFILALVGVIGHASTAGSPALDVAMAPAIVAEVVQDGRHGEPVILTVTRELAASHPQARAR